MSLRSETNLRSIAIFFCSDGVFSNISGSSSSVGGFISLRVKILCKIGICFFCNGGFPKIPITSGRVGGIISPRNDRSLNKVATCSSNYGGSPSFSGLSCRDGVGFPHFSILSCRDGGFLCFSILSCRDGLDFTCFSILSCSNGGCRNGFPKLLLWEPEPDQMIIFSSPSNIYRYLSLNHTLILKRFS